MGGSTRTLWACACPLSKVLNRQAPRSCWLRGLRVWRWDRSHHNWMRAGAGGLQPPPNSGDWPLLLAKAGITSPARHLPSAGTWSGNVLTWETAAGRLGASAGVGTLAVVQGYSQPRSYPGHPPWRPHSAGAKTAVIIGVGTGVQLCHQLLEWPQASHPPPLGFPCSTLTKPLVCEHVLGFIPGQQV